MSLRPPDLIESRPDNTQSIVGREGIPVRQDTDGTQIQRLGVPGADADWGPETVTVGAGGETKIANPRGVGGTSSSAGLVRVSGDFTVSLVYAWGSEDTAVNTISDAETASDVIVERPNGSQAQNEIVVEDVRTKSDNCDVFIETSAAQEITATYTLNFH